MFIAGFLLSVGTWDFFSEGGKQKVEKELKILAKSNWPYALATTTSPKEPQQIVIRSAAELLEKTLFLVRPGNQEAAESLATRELAQFFRVPSIDWKQQMVVVVTAGVKPTGGYILNISSISVNDESACVRWSLQIPKGFVIQALTHPAQMVLVPRFDGKFVFEELEKGKK